MLSFFIGVLLSLNVITVSDVPNLSKEEVLNLVDDVSLLAEIEGLDGHKNSAVKRKENLIGE